MRKIASFTILSLILHSIINVDGHKNPHIVIDNQNNLKISNIRVDGQNEPLTIKPKKGAEFTEYNHKTRKWVKLGKFDKHTNKALDLVFIDDQTTHTMRERALTQLIIKGDIKYDNKQLLPLFDIYYIVSSHGAETSFEQKERIDLTWNLRTPVKFFEPRGFALANDKGVGLAQALEDGNLNKVNEAVVQEVNIGDALNQHWAGYGKEFESQSGIYRVIITPNGNKPEITTQLIAILDQTTDSNPVKLTEIAEAVDKLGVGVLYWNACRSGVRNGYKSSTPWKNIEVMFTSKQTSSWRLETLKKAERNYDKELEETRNYAPKAIKAFKKEAHKEIKYYKKDGNKEILRKVNDVISQFDAKVTELLNAEMGEKMTVWNCELFALFEKRKRADIDGWSRKFEVSIDMILNPNTEDLSEFGIPITRGEPPSDSSEEDENNKNNGNKKKTAHREYYDYMGYGPINNGDGNGYTYGHRDHVLEQQEMMDILHWITKKQIEK